MAPSNRIALLAGANPGKCVTGPTVRLPIGKWRLGVHGKIDSEIILYIGSRSIGQIHDGCELVIGENADHGVRVEFSKRGREDIITIVASKD